MEFGKIYLSGAMSDVHYEARFREVARALTVMGHDVYNPADVAWGTTRYARQPSEGMRENTSVLVGVDTIFLMGEWRNARGCITEVMLGASFGCLIMELDVDALLIRNDLVLTAVDIHRDNLNHEIAALLLAQTKR